MTIEEMNEKYKGSGLSVSAMMALESAKTAKLFKMNIEEVKKRNDRRKVLMKERENEYSLVREIEYNRLVEGSVDDNAYLLSIIEQVENAFINVRDRGMENAEDSEYVVIADDALKIINGS